MRSGTFESDWNNVRVDILRFCQRFVGRDLAEDVFQNVALRAWRAYPKLRLEETSFLAWTLTIARNECLRALRKVGRVREMPTAPVDLTNLVGTVAPPIDIEERSWVFSAIAECVAKGELSEREGAVLARRLAAPHVGWGVVGQELGMTTTSCAVVFLRAKAKFKTALFVRRPDLLGGRDVVKQALGRAQRDALDPLSPQELRAFSSGALDGQPPKRAEVPIEELRSACAKVSKYLPMDLL